MTGRKMESTSAPLPFSETFAAAPKGRFFVAFCDISCGRVCWQSSVLVDFRWLEHASSRETIRSRSPSFCQAAAMILARVLRIQCLSVAKSCSTGLRSER
jgi:hypothetical protein